MSVAVPLSIPRWQWRTVATDLADLFSRIPGRSTGAEQVIEETHIVCRHSFLSVVLAEERLTVSWKKETAAHGFERWDSILDLTLPFRAGDLERLWAAWDVPRPQHSRSFATTAEFLQSMIGSGLSSVRVTRRQHHAIVDGIVCTLEWIETDSSARLQSLAIEHEDPSLMLGLLERLELDASDNINFVQGLRCSLDFQALAAGTTPWPKKSNASSS